MTAGPLARIRVLELPAIGPVPFAAMMLADLGADVIRLDRPGDVSIEAAEPLGRAYAGLDPTGRNRRRVAIDLKAAQGVQLARQLAASCDVLLEGFRGGVAERLGLGPDACMAGNPALVYGRMTGYGQDGPLAQQAGHDINYLALSGALDSIGHDGGPPAAPVGYLGDFGGGGLYLAFGVLAALTERQHSGAGQVVDAAIIDGVSLLGSVQRYLRLSGAMPGPRGTNELDGGHPLYGVYETADSQWISFGAVEPRFRAGLMQRLGIEGPEGAELAGPATWLRLRRRIAKLISERTRAQWEDLLAGSEICFAPVLSHEQAMRHPHHVARQTFVDVGGESQVAPGPRFGRTPPSSPRPAPPPGADTHAVLTELGLSREEIATLERSGIVAAPPGRSAG
ncbi:MAG TPA: CaiB/BaiF CoA-transferase family protein [Streptosporangiaceae bacterium]|nr:CaiB/BaiF CoA-transferase family protein [Streptosporangiaceae bacterium]